MRDCLHWIDLSALLSSNVGRPGQPTGGYITLALGLEVCKTEKWNWAREGCAGEEQREQGPGEPWSMHASISLLLTVIVIGLAVWSSCYLHFPARMGPERRAMKSCNQLSPKSPSFPTTETPPGHSWHSPHKISWCLDLLSTTACEKTSIGSGLEWECAHSSALFY